MSWVASGNTYGSLPVVICIRSSRSSDVRRIYPSFTVGEIANPLVLMTRLPFVVSTDRMASSSSDTSSLFTWDISTGEPIKGTGSCGAVGAFGQIWVEINTSPSSTSPLFCISRSLAARATAARAPSPSDTKPMRSGRAPIPPSRPRRPIVGALPPFILPLLPGILTFSISVVPLGPFSSYTVMSASGCIVRRYSSTFVPVT